MSLTFTYYGHSTFAIDADGTKLVIDPFFAPNNPLSPSSAEQVEADFILISHGHGDHIADATALAKRTGALVISNFEIITWLANQGAEHGHGMNTGGAYSFPFGRVKCTIAHHSSALPDGSNGGNPMGFLI
ncbi:MAG TPA: MBL fold metallo-hydrolase, partial [Caldilineaceae bacterium]|nr:MBL fold metallo-hydrolase [Caldilineaceae bacterium]